MNGEERAVETNGEGREESDRGESDGGEELIVRPRKRKRTSDTTLWTDDQKKMGELADTLDELTETMTQHFDEVEKVVEELKIEMDLN